MKKSLILITSLFVSQANATVLSFDEIPGGNIQNAFGDMPIYSEFSFSTTLKWIDLEGTRDWNFGARSGEFALTNRNGRDGRIGQGGTITEQNGEYFTFDGLWAKRWRTPEDSGGADSLFGTLEGYKNKEQVWKVETSLNGSYEYYGAQSGLIDELKLDFGNQFLVDDLSLTVSPVPEPSSIALMLGGLGLVGFMAARRTKNS